MCIRYKKYRKIQNHDASYNGPIDGFHSPREYNPVPVEEKENINNVTCGKDIKPASLR